MSNEAVVRALYQAYHARKWEAFRALVIDGFRFTSPYDDAIDIEAYHERCWPPGDRQRIFEIERITADDDGAFVTYMITTADGVSFRNTEYLCITAARVRSVDVYFGASYRRGAFEPKKPD